MLTVPVFGASPDKEGNKPGSVVAAISLCNKEGGKFEDKDVQFMIRFMAIVGPILEQTSLYQSIRDQTGNNGVAGKEIIEEEKS